MAPALSPDRNGFAASWRRELQSLRGNRADLLLVTVLPLLMLAVMAWMFSPSVMRDIPIAVVDLDHSSDNRLLLRMLDASPGVRIASQPADLEDARSQLRRLDVFAIVLVPRDVTRQALRGRQGTVFAYYNATYMTTGQSASRDIGDAVSAWNARLLRERIGLQVGPGKLRAAPIAVQSDILYNPARSYELFLLPLIFPAVLSLVLALAVAGSLGRGSRRHPARLAGSNAVVGDCRQGRAVHPAVFAVWRARHRLPGLAARRWCGRQRAPAAARTATVLPGHGRLRIVLRRRHPRHGYRAVRGRPQHRHRTSVLQRYLPGPGWPLFTRIWHQLLPLSAYIKLQTQQQFIGSPLQVSVWPLATLLLMAVVAGGIGGLRLIAFARRPEAAQPAGTDA